MTTTNALIEREYWNYSTDFRPTSPENIPVNVESLHRTRKTCERDAKKFCRSVGIAFDSDMIAKIEPDLEATPCDT